MCQIRARPAPLAAIPWAGSAGLGHAAEQAAVEQQLHLMLAFLPSIRYGAAWRRRLVGPGEIGLEPVIIACRTAVYLARQRERVGVGGGGGGQAGPPGPAGLRLTEPMLSSVRVGNKLSLSQRSH